MQGFKSYLFFSLAAICLFLTLFFNLDIFSFSDALAQDAAQGGQVASSKFVQAGIAVIQAIVDFMAAILFYEVLGFPMLVAWLLIGGVFFTFRLGFANVRLFKHAIDVVRGKYTSGDEPGEVTHFQALTAAVSATVGLGNIAGVAIAVSVGGPGAVVWMMIAGFFGMSAKFAEVTLGQKYRTIDKNGKVSGGAFRYLKQGLAEKNMPMLGKILAAIFAVFCIGGSFGGGNLFQANQTVSIMTNTFTSLDNFDWVIAFVIALSVGVVLIGGIKRIARVAASVVPLMAFIYIAAAIIVIIVNSHLVADAVVYMFKDAFTGVAMGGGLLGVIINGFKRATFSNEAGLGSAPIAHSAAKTNEPVREGCVALLEPFLDTMVICFMTGLVITITGVYQSHGEVQMSGVMLTSNAFSTVIDWFPMVLAVAVALFAYSTMITWSYYGERAWAYLFGKKTVRLYHILFCVVTFLGGIMSDISLVVDFSDLLLLSMAIPNLIGLYIMSDVIKADLDEYVTKLKNGGFKVFK